ncbi:MAG: cupin domain-containing protein [Suipraeoptans sp.]
MEAKREGKYLAKFGSGKAFQSDYGIYVEQTDSVLDTSNFLVGSSFCVPNQRHGTHSHPDHDEVILFLNGTGIQRIGEEGNEEVYEVRDNDMVYIPAGVPHSIENQSNQPIKMVIIKVNKGKVQ